MAPPAAVYVSQQSYIRAEDDSQQNEFPKSFADAVRTPPDEAIEIDEAIEANETVGSNEAIEPNETVEANEAIEPDETVEPNEAVELDEIVEPNEAAESNDKSLSDSAIDTGDFASQDLPSPEDRKFDASQQDVSESDDTVSDIKSPSPAPKSILKSGINTTPRKDRLVEVRYSNGDGLTSVREDKDYRESLELDDSERPASNENDSHELVSGRRAGAGWERSGIRWAPLNVPLKRRLQTLVVLYHTLCVALMLSSFFLLCALPIFWPVLFPYMIYLHFSQAGTSGTLSRRSNFLRSSKIWSLFGSYFPARLHRSQYLPPTRKYVFGYHPHGIISHGAFAAFATEALGFSQLFPGITNTLLTLDSNFRVPFYRDYLLAMGLSSVSRTSCENLLNKGGANGEGMGRALTIVVGGAAESLDAQPRSLRLVLAKRKGFVKLAVRAGADLVPVLAFGENDLYEQITPESHPGMRRFQLGVKKVLGFTVPFFFARGIFNYDVGLLPYRRPLDIVVGRAIKVVQAKNPDEAYVAEIHALYVRELKRIWEEWKGEFAKGMDGELEIVE